MKNRTLGWTMVLLLLLMVVDAMGQRGRRGPRNLLPHWDIVRSSRALEPMRYACCTMAGSWTLKKEAIAKYGELSKQLAKDLFFEETQIEMDPDTIEGIPLSPFVLENLFYARSYKLWSEGQRDLQDDNLDELSELYWFGTPEDSIGTMDMELHYSHEYRAWHFDFTFQFKSNPLDTIFQTKQWRYYFGFCFEHPPKVFVTKEATIPIQLLDVHQALVAAEWKEDRGPNQKPKKKKRR